METDVFAPREGPWLGEKEERERNAVRPIIAAAVGLALLLGTFLLGAQHGSAPMGALRQQNAALRSEVAALRRSVSILRQQWGHCNAYSGDLTTIKHLMAQGHFNSATQVANLDLSNTRARPCDPMALAALWYSASLDALTSTPAAGPDDVNSILTWQSINARATAFGLPPDARTSPLTIIATAFNMQNWALCRFVFQQAWGSLIGPNDRLEIVTYYSATRDEGRALVRDFTGAKRKLGLRLLATAAAVGTPYLERGEAAADLTTLLGPTWQRRVQPDGHDPILRSLRRGR